jgi:hypothetical protein
MMIQAQYTFQDGKITYNASVTLKRDGKLSFSNPMSKHMTAAKRYQIKALGQQIAAANFEHPSVIKLIKEEHNDKLVGQLFEKTKELKERIIEQTKIYTTNKFANYQKQLKRTEVEWFEAFEVKWEMSKVYWDRQERPTPVQGEYSRKNYYRMKDAKEKARNIVNGGYEKFEAEELKDAMDHYQSNIEKLAYRLHQMGVSNETEFEVLTAWVQVNLAITIKYAGGIINAWTIIAEGPVQKAHYRYLIK